MQPNSVRVRCLAGNCFVLPSVEFKYKQLVHCINNYLIIMTNQLTLSATSTIQHESIINRDDNWSRKIKLNDVMISVALIYTHVFLI